MRKSFGVVHAISFCENCGWESQNHKNAQANAARHAKSRGHVVRVEIGISGFYDGSDEVVGKKPVKP